MKGPYPFTNKNRADRLQNAANEFYDLIIIGGGITGVGIALDASLRGLKCILLEKNDFASGTSSKSTKLIHGGLRYLKQFEISLVRETGLERSIVHENACHLVHPEPMLLPIVENGSFNKLTASLAISVYDWLAKVEKKDKMKMLDKEEVLEMEPLLKEELVKSGIIYSEYRTDDARLSIELIKEARRQGAEAFNYLQVESFIYEKENIKGIIAKDLIQQKKVHLHADIVVNATGPWVDQLINLDKHQSSSNVRLSKGVHIVLSKEKLPIQHSTYFDAFDGRMIFAIPRGEKVYVGTTDTDFEGNQNLVQCNKEDAEYLLGALNHFFEIEELSIEDIESTWAGLRPLIQQKGKAATEISRKDEIFQSETGLLSIAGGKLTGFRKMAERIVDLVFERNEKRFVQSKTKHHKIHYDAFEDYNSYLMFIQDCYLKYNHFGIQESYFVYLGSTFGKDAALILESSAMKDSNDADQNMNLLYLAQLDYTMKYESIWHPLDFLERRTGDLYFNISQAKSYAKEVCNFIANEFAYNGEELGILYDESIGILNTNSLSKLKK